MMFFNELPRTRVFSCVLGLLLGGAGALPARDLAALRVVLTNSGAIPGATATATALLNERRSSLKVSLSHLTPGATYVLRSGGDDQASFTAGVRGEARLDFSAPPKRRGRVLDFDPRGLVMEIMTGTNVVLAAVFSGDGEPAGSRLSERMDLLSLAGGGRASVSYAVQRTGGRRLTVALRNVTGTNWTLYVNGHPRGTLQVRGRGGRTVFDDSPAGIQQLLDFDPRGQVIDIAQSTNLLFSGRFEARARDLNFARPSLQTFFIPSTGVDADGTARTRYRVDKDARRKFSVELEDVPAGGYELLADGALRGTINVAVVPGGTVGEIEFSSREDDGDEQPLTFDPLKATNYVVRQGATVFFEGALSGGVPGISTNDAPQERREALSSTGLDSDGAGDAKFEIDDDGRRKFSVEIEDVPVGSYQLWVGGVKRGTIPVVSAAGKVEGEIEFSTHDDDDDELPLTFEPRGQLIEIKNSAGVYFAHLFGAGGGATNASAVPVRTELPLFTTGVDANGTARMEFKRDDRGRRGFEVEVEDVPEGEYGLLVGGVNRGTITVVAGLNGTRGLVEFEDDDSPEPGELPLNFDPLGQNIAIERDAVVYFERVLPVR